VLLTVEEEWIRRTIHSGELRYHSRNGYAIRRTCSTVCRTTSQTYGSRSITDTTGFTDHVFALIHLLGFRFAPRIRDLSNTKLYLRGAIADYSGLKSIIGGT
jgi:hypothetical protein